MGYRVDSYGISDIGKVRQNNEDVFEILPSSQFFILADGMGGHNAGEVAALEAVESMKASLRASSLESPEKSSCLLRKAVEAANRRVFELSQDFTKYSGMGTTMSCFLLREDKLIYAHVGDSRIYRFRKKLEQLTTDHSLRALMSGQESSNGHEKPTHKHIITRAVGTTPHILPDIGILSVQEGDSYLICSDGLTDLVSDEGIEKILSEGLSLRETVKTLVETALKKGGNDNITVLMVHIGDEEQDLSR